MNLAIDVGNTLVKLGVFSPEGLQIKKTCTRRDFLQVLTELSTMFPQIHKSILSSVAQLSKHQLTELRHRFDLLVLDHQTKVPFLNKYTTPHTLGIDRIALVSAAAKRYAGHNALIIDSGTCITYDFLNSRNEYLGGAISPGIAMRYKAMHTFTQKLPLLQIERPGSYLGNSTDTAMHSGVVHGVLYEIDGHINEYKKNHHNLTVILTGGNTHFLRDSIKNDIFAHSNFLLEGLNHILEYNNH